LEKKQQHLKDELNKTQQTKTTDVGYAKEKLLHIVTFTHNRRDDSNDFIEILKTVKIQGNTPCEVHIANVLQGAARSWWNTSQHKVIFMPRNEQLKH